MKSALLSDKLVWFLLVSLVVGAGFDAAADEFISRAENNMHPEEFTLANALLQENNLPTFREYLVSLRGRDEVLGSLLNRAAAGGKHEFITEIMAQMSQTKRIHTLDPQEPSPLIQALQTGNLDTLDFLLQRGIKEDSPGRLFEWAIANKCFHLLSHLVVLQERGLIAYPFGMMPVYGEAVRRFIQLVIKCEEDDDLRRALDNPNGIINLGDFFDAAGDPDRFAYFDLDEYLSAAIIYGHLPTITTLLRAYPQQWAQLQNDPLYLTLAVNHARDAEDLAVVRFLAEGGARVDPRTLAMARRRAFPPLIVELMARNSQ